MADTRLTIEAADRPTGLAHLWPFPGVLLLVVFGAWLFYMGSIAGMEDVATAFNGLGGVTALLLVLALRAMVAGRVRRRSAALRTPHRRRRHAERAGVASVGALDDPFAMPRRSAIVDEGAAPAEGSIYPGVTPGSGMPLNARTRARQEELRSVPLADDDLEPDETPRELRRSEPTDAAFEEAGEEDDTSADRPPVLAEPLPPRSGESPRVGEVRATLRQLEARINRERADRGAQIARLEALLKAEAEALRAAAPGPAGGPAGDAAAPPALAELAASVETVAARLAALEAQSGAPEAESNGQLLKRVEEMIDARVTAALDPQTARQSLWLDAGAVPGAGTEPADGLLGERIAAAHAAIAAANEAAQAEREAIRTEVERLRRSAQQALSAATAARRSVGDLAEGESTVAEQLASLRAAIGGVGATSADTGALEGRLAAVAREVDEMRGNLGAVTQHVARMGEHYQDLLARLERIGDQIAPERPPAAGSLGVQGEVDALRDALTTIIEQNREIRAQQDVLSARLEGSAGRES